jgi:putative IMPACT (imprinted ancient) family translation regulator
MKVLSSYTLEVKKSKFIAYFYELDTQEEVKEIWRALKKEHKKARHIPYAYYFQNSAGKSDDKEPSNTAGLPLYRLLEKEKFSHHAIFVVRYFGGIKLGAGGLIRSYANAALKAMCLGNEKK